MNWGPYCGFLIWMGDVCGPQTGVLKILWDPEAAYLPIRAE